MKPRGRFAERLVEAVARTGPLCAGIDPSPSLLAAWGLPDDPSGLATFVDRCLEAFAGTVPVVKPQVAFFERHGAAGLAVFEQLVAAARPRGLLVIADAKRADIDSTAEAYADAWLADSSPLAADAVTAVPYLGLGALRPMVERARRSGRGLFVVVRSSNPEGRVVQEAVTRSGTALEDALLEEIAALNVAERGPDGGPALGTGTVWAVIGATLGPSAFALSDLGGPVLAPGLGAQGATADDVKVAFAGCRPGTVLPSVSRSVLAQGPSIEALRAAASQARDEVAARIT